MATNPNQGFLNALVVLMRNSARETGKSLQDYMADFDNDPNKIREYMVELYPPKGKHFTELQQAQKDDDES